MGMHKINIYIYIYIYICLPCIKCLKLAVKRGKKVAFI